MARKNIDKLVKEAEKILNPRYDMKVGHIHDIIDSCENETGGVDLTAALSKAYLFGYIQGAKAERAAAKRISAAGGEV